VAEYLPVADRSVEAVTVSSAWHWMDTGTTSAEIARVLRPDGVLGILWNGPNRSVDWVGQLLEGGDRPAADADGRRDRHRVELPPGAPFEDLETCVITWSLPMTREELVGLTGTYSRVITLPPDQRAVEMAHIEDRVAASPLLSGQSAIEMPMSCRCWRAIRQ
jgi:SAM-dependent methyltransferase